MDSEFLIKDLIDIAFNIHVDLGPGLLESVYEAAFAYELHSRGWKFEQQKPIKAFYKGVDLGVGFRADFIVENLVIVELKSVENLAKVHYKQVLTYLKLTDNRFGILLNFNTALMKDGIKRIVNGY